MTVVWILMWLVTSTLAYYTAKAAIICCSKSTWDKATKEFVMICSFFLGPVFLLVSAELIIFAAIGEGLGSYKTRGWRN